MVRKQELYRYAVDIFIELVKQVTKRSRLNYRCNDSDVSAWNSFIDEFSARVGKEFVRKFAEYGIQSWFNDGEVRDYSKAVRFSWVFGKNAISRWKKLGAEVNVRITQNSLKQNYDINVVKHESNIGKVVTSLREVEERFKKEYHNTKRGLAWCIANTTLYHHKSSLCATCIYKKECKDILKNEYPKIYKIRGYER